MVLGREADASGGGTGWCKERGSGKGAVESAGYDPRKCMRYQWEHEITLEMGRRVFSGS